MESCYVSFLVMTSLMQHVFKIHSCFSMYQYLFFVIAEQSVLWTYNILFIHLSVNGLLDFFHWHLHICLQVTVWIQVFRCIGYIPRSRIAASNVTLCLTIQGARNCFSKVVIAFYIFTSNVRVSLSVHPHKPGIAILVGVKWYLIVVLILFLTFVVCRTCHLTNSEPLEGYYFFLLGYIVLLSTCVLSSSCFSLFLFSFFF